MSMARCKDSKITKDSVILYYGNGSFEVVPIKDAMSVIPAEAYENKFFLSNSVAKMARRLGEHCFDEKTLVLHDAAVVLAESCKSFDGLCDLARKWGVL